VPCEFARIAFACAVAREGAPTDAVCANIVCLRVCFARVCAPSASRGVGVWRDS
jgi:hypothetical protein